MKKTVITLVFFLGITLGNAQFFTTDSPEESTVTEHQNTGNFFQDTPESGGGDNLTQRPPLPNPGEESPINQWVLLLPLVGAVLGSYYLLLQNRKKTI